MFSVIWLTGPWSWRSWSWWYRIHPSIWVIERTWRLSWLCHYPWSHGSDRALASARFRLIVLSLSALPFCAASAARRFRSIVACSELHRHWQGDRLAGSELHWCALAPPCFIHARYQSKAYRVVHNAPQLEEHSSGTLNVPEEPERRCAQLDKRMVSTRILSLRTQP